MSGVYWVETARDARQTALEYVARTSISAALRQLADIDKQTNRLTKHPHLGRPGRIPNTRELSITRTPYIAVYRIIGDDIQIMRFLHSSQQR